MYVSACLPGDGEGRGEERGRMGRGYRGTGRMIHDNLSLTRVIGKGEERRRGE